VRVEIANLLEVSSAASVFRVSDSISAFSGEAVSLTCLTSSNRLGVPQGVTVMGRQFCTLPIKVTPGEHRR
jgi:hypothetical protein